MVRRTMIALGATLAAGWAQAATYTTVDVPGARTTAVLALNAKGDVAGFYTDNFAAMHGFMRFKDGSFVFYNVDPGGDPAIPFSINLKRQSAGSLGLAAFIADAAGNVQSFQKQFGQRTNATGIASNGVISGFYYDGDFVVHGYLRKKSGNIHSFDVRHAGTAQDQGTFVAALNADGATTGYIVDGNDVQHAFIRAAKHDKGAVFDPPGAGSSQGLSINAGGDVSGFYRDANSALHGFVRLAAGTIESFDASNAGTAKDQGTEPLGINVDGTVAGWVIDGNGVYHGFSRLSNGQIADFDAPDAQQAPGVGTYPQAINDKGVIAGSFTDIHNRNHGFIRAP